jgi:hypothetical protein
VSLPPMPPERIREHKQRIDARLEELRVTRELVLTELKGLQIVCKHPTPKRTGDYSGATYSYCPDCGREPL